MGTLGFILIALLVATLIATALEHVGFFDGLTGASVIAGMIAGALWPISVPVIAAGVLVWAGHRWLLRLLENRGGLR